MYEHWEDIPDFPRYQVSNYGRIRNAKTQRQIRRVDTGRQEIVSLRQGLRTRTVRVCTLVADMFLEPRIDANYVPYHKDGDYLNNEAKNLKWREIGDVRWATQHANHGNPIAERPVMIIETGDIFENVHECALEIYGRARYIHAAAEDPNATYLGFHFRFVD